MAVIALLFATASQAALMDCTQLLAIDAGSDANCVADELILVGPSTGLDAVVEAMPPQVLVKSGFELGVQASNSLPGVVPLMVLFAALVGVLLTRAKSFNSK